MARILITEDERIVAEDLKLVLQSIGHKVIAITATGENTIKLAVEKQPDVIFMDIHLDGELSGIDAAKKITEKQNIIIIFCSAYNDDHTLLRASALNPAGYIAKPFEIEEIETLMNLHVRFNERSHLENPGNSEDIFKKIFAEMKAKIKEILRPDVFKIQFGEDEIKMLFDRRILYLINTDERNSKLMLKLHNLLRNKTVNILKAKNLTNGIYSGRIYINGKHLSTFLR